MADASSTGSLDALLQSLQEEQPKKTTAPIAPVAQGLPASTAEHTNTPSIATPSSPATPAPTAARRTQKSDAPFQRKKLDISALPPLGGQGAPQKPKDPPIAGVSQEKEQSIPVPQGQKTTIRTMAHDIASAGAGGTISAGIAVEASTMSSLPKVTQQEVAPPPTATSLPQQGSQALQDPTHHSRVSSRTIAYVVVTAVALGAGAAYWISQSPEASRMVPRESKTPDTMPLPSGARQRLSSILGGTLETVSLSAAPSGVSIYDAASSLLPPLNRLRRFQITPQAGATPISHPKDIFNTLDIVRPSEMDELWGDEGALLAFGQPAIFNTKGVLVSPPPTQETRLVLIGEVLDVARASVAMDAWMATGIDKSLADLFRYDVLKAGTPDIQTGIYKSYTVHYKNFPRSDRALDYALIEDTEGRAYLVFANSKEALAATLDLFNAQINAEDL
ncbi:MAG: hypothetical protein AAB463_00370 [Patescibacteria group bacterium]